MESAREGGDWERIGWAGSKLRRSETEDESTSRGERRGSKRGGGKAAHQGFAPPPSPNVNLEWRSELAGSGRVIWPGKAGPSPTVRAVAFFTHTRAAAANGRGKNKVTLHGIETSNESMFIMKGFFCTSFSARTAPSASTGSPLLSHRGTGLNPRPSWRGRSCPP